MKTFLKILGIIVAVLIVSVYAAFLFVLPNVINLNEYTNQVKQLAKDSANLNVDYKNPKIYTTFDFKVGIKAEDLNISLPDKSSILSAEKLKAGISLPSLLSLTVNVSDIVVDSLKINADIMKSGEQFKISRHIENLLNKQNQGNELSLKKEEETPPVVLFSIGNTKVTSDMLISHIKIKVPNVRLRTYQANINDLHTNHKLTLQGDEIKLGYFNGKFAKIKTDAFFLSDNNTNIRANIDINSFLPPMAEADSDIDPAAKVVIPFVNPVELYRDYNLKMNINSKIKIRQDKSGLISTRGFADVDNIKLHLVGLNLPESYIHFKGNGNTGNIDSNIYIAKNEKIGLLGSLKYDKNPKLKLSLNSDKIMFNDCIKLAKAFLDTAKVKNNLQEIKGEGYFLANTEIKTNFKKLKSQGSVIVRKGSIVNKKHGKLIADINSDLLFDNNEFIIKDTNAKVNDTTFQAKGKIDKSSVANISLNLSNMPTKGFLLKLLGYEAVRNLDMQSGALSLNATLSGKLEELSSKLSLNIKNLTVLEKGTKTKISNKLLNVDLKTNPETIDGKICNQGLIVSLPIINSTVTDNQLNININNGNIEIKPSVVKLNNNSQFTVNGNISDYMHSQNLNTFISGQISTTDIKQILGREASFYVKSNGYLPIKASIVGNSKKQDITAQLLTNSNSYITPVDINNIVGKQNIFQAKLSLKGDKLRIKDTGLYSKNVASAFSNDLPSNIDNSKEIVGIGGTIVSLSTEPYINILRIKFAENLNGKICIFKNSSFTTGGNLWMFGKTESPIFIGQFDVKNLFIPQLKIRMQEAIANFSGNTLNASVNGLKIDNSDMQLKTHFQILQSTKTFFIDNFEMLSKYIDADKLLAVSEKAMKFTPPAPKTKSKKTTSSSADIPVCLPTGSFNITKAKSGNIIAQNTKGNISLVRNIFYITNVKTNVFNGTVNANVDMNLLNGKINIKSNGSKIDTNKALIALANMKDTISGTCSFKTDLSLQGSTLEEQMKSLKGFFNFEIVKGQLGPFGKVENMLMSENIRESAFFQNSIGVVVNNLTKINTSHFDKLVGKLTFSNGIVNINSIGSEGDCLCLYIAGKFNLLKNTCDMKIRGRLASMVSDMLGPIAMVNPVNLIKNTPGLNVASAKAFTLFCEEVTQKEYDKIPNFAGKSKDYNATKFQIILNGDVAKPLKLLKSFKWLALKSDIENANTFVTWVEQKEAAAAQVTTEEERAKIQAQKFDLELEKLKQSGQYVEQPTVEEKQSKWNSFIKNLKNNDKIKN